jgi:alkanesulfonate monooxygenase SsuD/methylene tetrahydromethanopterin reductase-like flavin-dependent oxidoreductase (luciferase family)
MRFGLLYFFSDFGNIPQRQLFNEVIEEIEFGEELGFDSVWLPEHHFAVYGMPGNPMTLAAAISQRTRTMKIGTAIYGAPFPPSTASGGRAALVDNLSDGRLLLGLGRGYQPPEFSGFGVAQHNSQTPGPRRWCFIRNRKTSISPTILTATASRAQENRYRVRRPRMAHHSY